MQFSTNNNIKIAVIIKLLEFSLSFVLYTILNIIDKYKITKIMVDINLWLILYS